MSISLYVSVCVYLYAYTYTCADIQTHTYTLTRIYTHTYTHILKDNRSQERIEKHYYEEQF